MKNRDEIPNASTRTALIAKLRTLGYTATALSAFIRAGRSRREIAEALIDLQRKAKKA